MAEQMSDRYLCKAKRTENGEWVEGSLLQFDDDYAYIIPRYRSASTLNKIELALVTMKSVDPSTICQYTGLPDKDKTQMYENDIVRASGDVHGVIRFGKYGDTKTDYGFYIKWDKSQPYWRNDICYWQDEIKVIGSYIDNPELLEGGAE